VVQQLSCSMRIRESLALNAKTLRSMGSGTNAGLARVSHDNGLVII
jgi:hypothetical protein